MLDCTPKWVRLAQIHASFFRSDLRSEKVLDFVPIRPNLGPNLISKSFSCICIISTLIKCQQYFLSTVNSQQRSENSNKLSKYPSDNFPIVTYLAEQFPSLFPNRFRSRLLDSFNCYSRCQIYLFWLRNALFCCFLRFLHSTDIS